MYTNKQLDVQKAQLTSDVVLTTSIRQSLISSSLFMNTFGTFQHQCYRSLVVTMRYQLRSALSNYHSAATYSVSQKNTPLRPAVFWQFFTNGWEF